MTETGSEPGQHRFSRLERLVGPDGMRRLAGARVAVIGLGGVGSYAVEALARAGVGRLILVDHDVVSPTNTNRQLHAVDGNYGRPKAEAMEERVRAIHPEAAVAAWKAPASPGNLPAILHGGADYVVDAIDAVAAKVALIEYCVGNGLPIVSVMGAGDKFDPLAFAVGDISRTHTCPLAKAVRKALRARGIERGVKAVYSTEPPARPLTDVPDCQGDGARLRRIPGSTSYIPPIAGLIAAGVVIQDLLRGNDRAES